MKVEEALEYVKRCHAADRVAHGYIVAGSPRAEGRAVADGMLQIFFCTGAGSQCGACRGCRGALEHTHPDLLWVEPQKKSRRISVEQVRDLQQRVFQTAFLGRYKVCVLVGADRLTAEASNAFLKTLEEPPARSVFLLLTDSPQFILPTIVSRCQTIGVSGMEVNLQASWQQALAAILEDERSGAGCIWVFSLAERFVAFLKELKAAAVAEVAAEGEDDTRDEEKDVLDARASARYREWRANVMRYLLVWYRDVLLISCGAGESEIFNQAAAESIRKRGQGVSVVQALHNVSVIEAMNRQLEQNLPEGLVFSLGFRRLT